MVCRFLFPDQWSPLNPEGKKQYDREFLLSLRDQVSSRTKPKNLPDLPDVILNQVHRSEVIFKLLQTKMIFSLSGWESLVSIFEKNLTQRYKRCRLLAYWTNSWHCSVVLIHQATSNRPFPATNRLVSLMFLDDFIVQWPRVNDRSVIQNEARKPTRSARRRS